MGTIPQRILSYHTAFKKATQKLQNGNKIFRIVIIWRKLARNAIEGERYDLSPGDFVLVGRGSIHRPEVAEDAFYERMILYIAPQYLASLGTEDCDLEECFRQAQDSFRYVYRDEGGSRVRQLFETLAQRLLAQGASPSEVGAQVGYQDYSTFSRAYKKQFGRGPSADVVHESTICMELGKNCDLQ